MQTTIARTIFALAILSLSATAANFSGRWKLDPEKSKLYGPYVGMRQERIVEHKEPELNVKITALLDGEEQATSARYTTDGKESHNWVGGNPMTTVVTWDGAALVFKSSLIQDTSTLELRDRWTPSETGKTL